MIARPRPRRPRHRRPESLERVSSPLTSKPPFSIVGDSGPDGLPATRIVFAAPVILPASSDDDLPQSLYRFMRREHADALLQHGKLRITDLLYYRGLIEDGTGLADNKDGTGYVVAGRTPVPITDSTIPQVFHLIGPEAKIFFQNIAIETRAPSVHVLCFSTEDKGADQMAYDACVEITDPQGFIGAITSALN